MSEPLSHQDHSARAPQAGESRFGSSAMVVLYGGAALVGVAGIGYGAWSYLHERAFLIRAVHVEARVIDVTLGVDPKKFTTYTPTYEFTDGQGNTWTNVGPTDTREYYKVGSSLPVLYDPDSPAQSQIDSFWSTWGAATGSTLVGALCLLLFLVSALSGRNQKRAEMTSERR